MPIETMDGPGSDWFSSSVQATVKRDVACEEDPVTYSIRQGTRTEFDQKEFRILLWVCQVVQIWYLKT